MWSVCHRACGRRHILALRTLGAHARRGNGTALLSTFLDAARQRGSRRAGLSTFRQAPFNARLGLAEIIACEANPSLRERFKGEIQERVDAFEGVILLRTL